MKMNKKNIVLIIIIAAVLVGVIYQLFFKKEKPKFTLADVSIGNVVQEVSETGQIQKGDKLNLSFKNAGRIEKIYTEVGALIKEGDVLAVLETTDLGVQYQEAKAALALAQAQLDKIIKGAGQEEIKAAQTTVANAEIASKNAEQNLKDITAQTNNSLSSVYEDALEAINDAYLKSYNALNSADYVQRTYFYRADQEMGTVSNSVDSIRSSVNKMKPYLDADKSNFQLMDTNLVETKKELDKISFALKTIREACESINYRNNVSATDKTALDTHRTYINTALTNINTSLQTISSTALTNDYNINTAKATVDTTKGALNVAKDALSVLTAPARTEDIDLYQAKVDQARASNRLLEIKIKDAALRSPVNGQVAEINKRVGELVVSAFSDIFITVLPENPYKIEANIYEEDVVKTEVGNEVDITLVSFPDQLFRGKVVSIDPAEKLIDGVVYYKVMVGFLDMPQGIKPGMSADLVIKTANKDNVLVVPDLAVDKKNGKRFVEVFKSENNIEQREVKIGLEGSNGLIEIVSGLKEGEKVVIR